jgi:ribose 5-phosphate isomerase B
MRVGIATDHGGFGLKEELVAHLHGAGHEVVDFGAHSVNPGDDYPDFVIPLANAVAAGNVERGVAICGSGVGASVCANKISGVRAGLIHDHFSAKQGVEDDHMNIICMGGRTVGAAVAQDLVDTFLTAGFSEAERPSAPIGEGCFPRGPDRLGTQSSWKSFSRWRRKGAASNVRSPRW